MEQERPDLLKQRRDRCDSQGNRAADRLMLLDETGLSTKMSRLRVRSACGEGCPAAIPHGHWKTTTFLGVLRLSGMTAPMVLVSAMNANAFRAFVQQILVPTLTAGDSVVMDNLSAHKTRGVREAIEAAGCQRIYLPAYSHDFNPIENAFAKLKVLLRAKAKGTVQALWDAIADLIDFFKPDECANYFKACGYNPRLKRTCSSLSFHLPSTGPNADGFADVEKSIDLEFLALYDVLATSMQRRSF